MNSGKIVARWDGTGGRVKKSKVLQEVLADLKRQNLAVEHCETILTFEFQMLKAKQKTKGHFDFVAVDTFSCVFSVFFCVNFVATIETVAFAFRVTGCKIKFVKFEKSCCCYALQTYDLQTFVGQTEKHKIITIWRQKRT